MIQIADNFQYNGKKPLDARLVYDNITSMKSVLEVTIYDGIIAYVKSEKKYYTYDSTNTSDPTLGKWRELETGGGGAGNIVEGYFNSVDNLFYEESTYTTAVTGEAEKIYIDLPNNKTYRFNGTIFVRLDEGTFENIQYDTLPTATVDLVGKIYQYTGTTSADYTQGYFYKCIENTSVTPYTYSWEEIKVSEDKEGHTILDTDGNAKTQREKLQFTGLDVADDSTNSKTEVKPFGLNSDDLDEIINTSEISNGYIQSQFNYSLEEQVVGKWIDGKPIYQKTFTGNLTIGSGDNIISSNFKSNNNIDVISKMEGTLISTNGNVYMLSCASSYYSEMVIESDNLIIRVKGFSTNYSYYATIQYTKATD